MAGLYGEDYRQRMQVKVERRLQAENIGLGAASDRPQCHFENLQNEAGRAHAQACAIEDRLSALRARLLGFDHAQDQNAKPAPEPVRPAVDELEHTISCLHAMLELISEHVTALEQL